MTRNKNKPVFGTTYRDTGYLFGNSVYTCCRNCSKQHDCPEEARGKKCTRKKGTCRSCTLWNEHGCRYFVMDRESLDI
jgi:hypothetical protein